MASGRSTIDEQDLADAALVLDVADAIARWQSRTGRVARDLKPLREAVWFFWQRPRLPKPRARGKYPFAYPWSKDARATFAADPGAQLVIEHTEPMTLLLRDLIDGPSLDAAATAQLLRDRLACVILTPDEDRQITSAGLRNRMPDGWRPDTDAWARYRAAGLDVDSFAPFAENER